MWMKTRFLNVHIDRKNSFAYYYVILYESISREYNYDYSNSFTVNFPSPYKIIQNSVIWFPCIILYKHECTITIVGISTKTDLNSRTDPHYVQSSNTNYYGRKMVYYFCVQLLKFWPLHWHSAFLKETLNDVNHF